jgi:hypothetical protein
MAKNPIQKTENQNKDFSASEDSFPFGNDPISEMLSETKSEEPTKKSTVEKAPAFVATDQIRQMSEMMDQMRKQIETLQKEAAPKVTGAALARNVDGHETVLDHKPRYFYYGTRFTLWSYKKNGQTVFAPNRNPIVFSTTMRRNTKVARGVETYCLCSYLATTQEEVDFIEQSPDFGVAIYKEGARISSDQTLRSSILKTSTASSVSRYSDNQVVSKVAAIPALSKYMGQTPEVLRQVLVSYMTKTLEDNIDKAAESAGQSIDREAKTFVGANNSGKEEYLEA